jgi:tetratricopeptide (TPR) repeat protein
MTGLQYPSNYVSTLHVARPTLGVELPENASARRIDEIRSALGAARDAYAAGEYRRSIDRYERARSLTFELVDPRDSAPWHVGYDDLDLPMGRDVELAIMDSGLQLAEDIRLLDQTAGSPAIAPETKLSSDALGLETVGFRGQDPSIADLNVDIQAGLEKLNEGAVGSSIERFRGVLSRLENPTTAAEKETAATAALNLSTALAMANDEQGADEAATRAEELFSQTNDDVGLSQARHNRGAALSRLEQGRAAEEQFEAAANVYARALDTGGGSSGGSGRGSGSERGRSGTGSGQPIGGSVPTPGGGFTMPNLTPMSGSLPGGTTGPQERGPSSSLRVDPGTILPSTDPSTLTFVEERDPERLNIRWPEGGVAGVPVPRDGDADSWELAVPAGQGIQTFTWTGGKRPDAAEAMETLLGPRVETSTLDDLRMWPEHPASQSLYLTHVYAFAVPVGLGDCHRQLGEYARAEAYYLKAADYRYLNRELEATNLWGKLAKNVQQWGDSIYREDDLEGAMEVYRKLLASDGTAPDTPLYQRDAFEKPRAQATTVVENLDDPGSIDVDPSIASPILTVWARWQYLNAGLDFYGTAFLPTYTFEYLRRVARTLAKQGIQAERSYVEFASRAEQEEARRRELEQTAEMAEKKADIARERHRASEDETDVYESSRDLAETRLRNAKDERNHYRSAGWWQYRTESARAAGRDDWREGKIRDLAQKFEDGETISGSPGKLNAAMAYLGGKKSYEYQLERLENDAEELRESRQIAEDRLDVARHRQEAARLEREAAETRVDLARDAIRAFENETFTPEVWAHMAEFMRDLARTYHDRAVEVAKLMERAYNFENDTDHSIISSDYGIGDQGGLLGSDALLSDIDAFSHRLVTETGGKASRLKDVVSIANDYPFQFHQFQQTGELSFETMLYDFDRRHPGFYGQRVQAVELEIAGLVPSSGVQGTLRSGGFSRYRTADGGADVRVHSADTLALSEYEELEDRFVFRTNPEEYGLFEGHGVATTWHIDLPQRANNFDFRRIRDVRLVVYYEAQYDADLAESVESREPLPGELTAARDFQPRYDFPESWYAMLDDRELTYELTAAHLPRTQEGFTLDRLSVVLETAADVTASDVDLTVTLPGQQPVTVTTDADGRIDAANTSLSDALGGDVLGTWSLVIEPPDGSELTDDGGGLDPDAIDQVLVLTEYDFQYRG